jgi:hypothetical protein
MKFTLDAGYYYIGCPSRVTNLKRYKTVKTSIQCGNFLGSDGTKFRVESGKIVVIPCDKLYLYKEDASYFGLIRQFNKDVEVSSDEGKISIVSGKYTLEIDTNTENKDDKFTFESLDSEYEYKYEEEEEEEEEYEEEEEDEEENEEEEYEEEDEEENEEENEEEEEEEEQEEEEKKEKK